MQVSYNGDFMYEDITVVSLCHTQVSEDLFLKLKNMSKQEFDGEVSSGRFPPYIHYKVLYTSPQERRVQPSLMKVDLKGTNENPKLSFRIMQEACKFYTWLVCVCVCVCVFVCVRAFMWWRSG